MNVVTAIKDNAARGSNGARIGLIIPSVNTYSEPQFTHFAPAGLGIHISRARVAGDGSGRCPTWPARSRPQRSSSPTAIRT